jgi:hypothetical protein
LEYKNVLTQKQAIEAAAKFGWTGADAKRALEGKQFPIESNELMQLLCQYAGSELASRQRLQAAQKAQVTKKKDYIEKIELVHATAIKEFETTLQVERSQFVAVIAKIYNVAQRFGMKDIWVETLLSQYAEYYQNQSSNTNSTDRAA